MPCFLKMQKMDIAVFASHPLIYTPGKKLWAFKIIRSLPFCAIFRNFDLYLRGNRGSKIVKNLDL